MDLRPALVGLLGLFIPLFLWNLVSLVDVVVLRGILFLLGAGLGLGLALALLLKQTRSPGEVVFFTIVNGLVTVTAIGGLIRVVPQVPFTGGVLLALTDVVYLAVLAACWFYATDELARLGKGDWFEMNLVWLGLLGLAVVGASVFAFRLKARTGHTLPIAFVYLWLLGAFLLLFSSDRLSDHTAVGFLLVTGLVIPWSHALSTNGLFAIDGISTARLARMLVTGVETDIAAERLFTNLTTIGTIPALSMLSGLSVGVIVKVVVPAIGGISLVGIYLLAKSWLDPKWALAAGFLLSYHYPFLVSLPTIYRSAIVFPVLVAFYIALTSEWGHRMRTAAIGYAVAIPLLHDTVGIFLILVLGAAVVVGLLHFEFPDPRTRLRSIETLFNHTIILGLTFSLVFIGTPAFDIISDRFRIIVGNLTGGNGDPSSRRTFNTTIGSLDDTLLEVMEQGIIFVEVGIIAAMTALILLGWLYRGRLMELLPRVQESNPYENLMIGNAVVFGALVVNPMLGLPRVFLYAGPFLVILLAGAGKHLGTIIATGLAIRKKSVPMTFVSRIAIGIMATIIVIGFVVQTGLVAFALGSDQTRPALRDADTLRLRYYSTSDVAGNEWAIDHVTPEDLLYGDGFTIPLLTDDPELRHHTLRRITTKQDLTTLTTRGCVFLRAANTKSGQLLVYKGPRASVDEPIPPAWLEPQTVAYSAGNTRIVC